MNFPVVRAFGDKLQQIFRRHNQMQVRFRVFIDGRKTLAVGLTRLTAKARWRRIGDVFHHFHARYHIERVRFRLGKVFHADTFVFDISDIVQSRVQAGGFQRLSAMSIPFTNAAPRAPCSARMPPPQPTSKTRLPHKSRVRRYNPAAAD